MRWKLTKRGGTPTSAPSLAPIERFIRVVIPAIPGGRQQGGDRTGHLALVQRAAEDRGLSIKTIGRTTYFYDGRVPVGGMTHWTPTLVSRNAITSPTPRT
jgi:hypothetical protein